MPHLYMHIGWPKTGSTALQDLCAQNRDILASHGFAYYCSRNKATSIGSVSRDITKGRSLEEPSTRFTTWLEAQTAPNVLISSETLVGNNRAKIAAFIAPERWDSITVICYLRSQEEYLEGWYKQGVKWGSKGSLAQYLKRQTSVGGIADYHAYLAGWQAWCAALSNAHLVVRLFDGAELLNENIGSDFFAALGLRDDRLTAPRRNVSPSKKLIDLYLQLPAINRLQQINRVMVASGHPDATGSRDLLPPTMLMHVRAQYAATNAAVCGEFFPHRQALFDAKAHSYETERPSESLQELLLETLKKMRGEEVAEAARVALGWSSERNV